MVPGVLSVTDPLRRAEYCLLFKKPGRENCHICLYAPLTDRHTHEPFMVSPHKKVPSVFQNGSVLEFYNLESGKNLEEKNE